MRSVAGWMVVVSMMAAPAIAAGKGGQYDPCTDPGTRRIAIVFAKVPPVKRGAVGECEGKVYPDKKTVCAGDTVRWSVINACDVEEVADVRLVGLEAVTEKCSTVPRLELAAVKEIECRLKRDLQDVRQKYEVTGRIGTRKASVDPELDIRRPPN